MRSGKFAKGKKSYAISDIGGHRVPYTRLKTQWDGLRVDAEEYSPKHPQLDPPRQIVDAVALRNSRSDNAPENIDFFVGFNYDPFLDKLNRPGVGISGKGLAGVVTFDLSKDAEVTGTAGTGGVGTEIGLGAAIETGLAGTGGLATFGGISAYTNYTITVANPGSGNKYYVDGVLQQQLYLQEGSVYRLDQSDSSNSGHPLRFSTTSNGTHGSGTEYTTGVTTVGTPGSSGAYTQIVVASGAATLYYYCTNHSGMGGTAYTPATGTISLAITVANPGSGNKYYIDGGGPAPTISLTEGKTYRFDQSDSTNSGHPLRFSTTSGGSHSGGSEYTTGVTTAGTPGSSGAYTQIVVAEHAPTLYYYCTNHSGMGGQLNTPSVSSEAVIEITEILTGVGGTGGIGTSAVNGNPNVTGVGGTGAVGDETAQADNPTWGTGGWNEGAWGQ